MAVRLLTVQVHSREGWEVISGPRSLVGTIVPFDEAVALVLHWTRLGDRMRFLATTAKARDAA